jgi:CRP-like cAMP-binding protein
MPPATAVKTSHLAEVPLFSSLSRRDLQRVVSASDQVSYKAGRTIVEQGRPGHEFFLILEGQANVRRNGRKVATLGPGQYFGELAPLSKGPRDATVVADTDMQLLVVGQRELLAVLEDVPEITLKLLRNLAARLRAVESSA